MRRARPQTLPDLITAYGLTNGVANIIMQLALPAVGYGVHESRVISGSPRRRPIKRTRTTSQYLAVAVFGDDADRDRMRTEVADVHRAVISTPDSPTRYSGNSPDLQKWVAACLFRFYLDQYTTLYGDLSVTELDSLTRSASTLATTLNVRESAWPQTWDEYERYWNETLPRLAIDDAIRADFESLAGLEFITEAWGPLGRGFPLLGGRHYRFMTRANLPAEFRTMMKWDWTDRDQRRLNRVVGFYRTIDRAGVRALVRLAYRVAVADFRLRARLATRALGRTQLSDTPIKDGGGLRWPARH
ncbi:oxygenase MpaB family protein [Gordonia liuliyuniae]|uniref:Oxygenase MpaB family protein n=1 Tax=Gordonia liuliyuniae TaxID=2911517 RepID=A0ABS9IRX3_9ACTN|nr:oxygenase MpaB family protein [Gordonia liuliyuniae]MCF8588307.1 oxygenase MpaB family protein [Gordonia liuliyuniae]